MDKLNEVFEPNEVFELVKDSLNQLKGMRRYEGQVFEHEHVVLDNSIFINCTFKDCTIEFSGGDVSFFGQFQVVNSPVIYRGAAMRTLSLLQTFGMLKAPEGGQIQVATSMPGKVN